MVVAPRRSEMPEEEKGKKDCAICQDVVKRPSVTLPCGHEYCSDCFESWRSKYDARSERTCPECREKVPPTREMLSQLKMNRQLLMMLRGLLHQTPYPIPTVPGDSDYTDYDFRFDGLSMEDRRAIQKLNPDAQQTAMRIAYQSQVTHMSVKLQEMEDRIGGNVDRLLLQDSEDSKVEDLPMSILGAAREGNVEKVLKWLGTRPPFSPERLNAKCSNYMDRTLLHEAEFENNVNLMSVLLMAGADVNCRSSYGSSPLDQACSMGMELDKAARFLLTWGGKICETSSEEAYNAGNKALSKLLKAPLGGRRCEIIGLDKRPELNGLMVITTKYAPNKNLYVAKFEAAPTDLFKVKPENLKRRDRTPLDPGVFMSYLGSHQATRRNIYRPSICFATELDKEIFEKNFESDGYNGWKRKMVLNPMPVTTPPSTGE